jgi:sugar/nucleoside kinase (ribokinase family)
MTHDITAIGNALIDTQFKVEQDFLEEIGMKPDEMIIQSRDEQNAILDKLLVLDLESVVDCGGSATNSLVAASYFGSSCHHVCKLNDDEDGNKYLKSLSEAGIDHIGISSNDQATPTGKCLVLVTPDAARTMCSTLGISEHLSEKDINFEYLQKSKIFYIEGYMVTSDSNFNSVTKSLDSLKGFETKKILSLSHDGIVHSFRDRFEKILSYKIDFVFGNLDEALAITETENIDDAIEALKEKDFTSIITDGLNGSFTINNGDVIKNDGLEVEAIDTNGAGDMFAGAFMHAMLSGKGLHECGAFANLAASKIVQTFGPRLKKEEYQDLLENL